MATPAVMTDGTSVFDAATLNKFLAAGDANKAGCKVWFGRLRYTGAAWEVHGSTDAAGISALVLAWNAGSSQLEVTLSGFTTAPLVVASPIAADAAYTPRGSASSSTLAVVKFTNASGVLQTTESTAMDACILIVGA